MKKAILYVRVSTDEQAIKGYSLIDQEERLKIYCERMKIEVVRIFKEDHSAKDFNRPEFKKLMQSAREQKRQINQLLFVRWDRFSRNVSESYRMIDRFHKMGIELIAIEQPVDMTIPENKIMLSIFLAVPEVENDRRSMNTTQGMRRARKQGRWSCTALKGYSNKRDENNKPIIVPNDDAVFVKEAFSEIAKGIKPYDHVRQELNKKGFVCSKSNFATLIRNVVYIGKIRIKPYMDEPEELVDGIHKPLIGEETFYKVQDLLNDRNKTLNRPKVNRQRKELPLRGFLFCPKCDNKLTGSGSKGEGGRYFYYHCNHCRQVRIRADLVDKGFLRKIRSFKIKPEFKDLFLKIFNDYYNNQEKGIIQNEKAIREKISNLERRITGLQDKLADDLISSEDYNEMKNRYQYQIAELKVQKTEIKISERDLHKMMEQALLLLENLDKAYTTSSLDDKQRLISSIFTGKIYFDENKVRTTDINEVVKLICKNNKAFRGDKKRLASNFQRQSCQVAPRGIEPLSKV
ncbi:MAG: recombinase family protein, partial [Bacteroidales bacterium]|nr:recombinase family protein [Bacteroidales bacterium]